MEQIESALTTEEQDIIISQLAPTLQAISKHYTNGLQHPSDLPTAMRIQFQESMAGFNQSYGARLASSLVESCTEYNDFDTIVQSVSATNTAEQNRLRNIIRATDTQSQQYLALANLSNATSFLFISEQSDTTCDRCLSRHGKLYSIDDLKSGTSIPPLHPNCQCAFVALDMAMTVQYNQYTQQFIEYVTNRLSGYFGLFQLSGNGTLTEIPLFNDESAQIYHLIDASTSYDDSISLPSSIDQFVQWATEFGGDAADVLDAFIQQSQLQLDNAADMLSVNPLFAVVLFADAMTGTVTSSILQIIESLASNLYEEPSLYNLFNLLTLGWVEVTEHALQPDDPWSFQHFIDMIGSVTFLLGAIKGVSSVASKFDDILSQHMDDAVRGSVDDVLDDVIDDIVDPQIPANSLETQASVVKKLDTYLLNEAHTRGGSKAKWFREALGFTQENLDDLAKQIIFDEYQAVPTQLTEYGQQYNQIISITGANGRKIDVLFGWIRNQDGVIRLTTGIPTKK